MKLSIPFNKPFISDKSESYIKKSIFSQISGDGDFTKNCSQFFENLFESKKVLITTSCTHALEMSALLLDIKPGDEVIVPSYTFVSTANAFVVHGAKPVFADIRLDTLNIDESKIEVLINEKTRAIIPVHYAGVGCEMDALMDISSNYDIPIIEDNAHGLFGDYKGKKLGTFSPMSTLSFHETKNITCGEGGALVINDERYSERAEIIREKGTDRSRFFRGQVDKYSWKDIGSSFLPSDILCAFLYSQIKDYKLIQKNRKTIWNTYYDGLQAWAEQNKIKLPFIPSHCNQSFHMFYMIMPSYKSRQMLIEYLSDNGIASVFHYLPLHLSEMAKKLGISKVGLPNSEYISDRIIRLPFYASLNSKEQLPIINIIKNFQIRG